MKAQNRPAQLLLTGILLFSPVAASGKPRSVPPDCPALQSLFQKSYADLRRETKWNDPETENVHTLLDQPLPESIIQRLKPRWVKIDQDVRNLNWNLREWSPPRDFQKKRMSLSTTISGTNSFEIHNANKAMENWAKAEAQVRQWILEGKKMTTDRMFQLNGIIGDGLKFNGQKPGTIRSGRVGIPFLFHGSPSFQAAHASEDVPAALKLF